MDTEKKELVNITDWWDEKEELLEKNGYYVPTYRLTSLIISANAPNRPYCRLQLSRLLVGQFVCYCTESFFISPPP